MKTLHFTIPVLCTWFAAQSLNFEESGFQELNRYDDLRLVVTSTLMFISVPMVIYFTGNTLYLATWGAAKNSKTALDDILYMLLSWVVAGMFGFFLLYASFVFEVDKGAIPDNGTQIEAISKPESGKEVVSDSSAQDVPVGSPKRVHMPPKDHIKLVLETITVLIQPIPLYDVGPDPKSPIPRSDKNRITSKTYIDGISNFQLFFMRIFVVFWVTTILIMMLRTFCTEIFQKLAAKTLQKKDDMAVELVRIYGTFLIAAMGIGWGILLVHAQYGQVIMQTDGGNVMMPYAILVAVIGGVLGVGSKDLLENFFAGVSLQIDSPFELGERIVLPEGEVCEVRSIGMRSTHFYNISDNSDMYVPNTVLSHQTVTNLSRPDRQYRRIIEFFVSDDKPDSLKQAEGLLILTALSVNGVDIPTIKEQHHEKSSFFKGRPSIIEEYQKLQSRFDEVMNAQIRIDDNKKRPISDVVKETSDILSNKIRELNKTRKIRWNNETGLPAEYFDRVSCEEGARQSLFIAHKFYMLAMCLYTLGASYPALRTDLERLTLEILRVPSVRSSHTLTEDGRSVWRMELMVYARLTEQSDEVVHHVNMLAQQFLREFDLIPEYPVSRHFGSGQILPNEEEHADDR